MPHRWPLVLLALASGCGVSSRSGSKSMPPDLRSSADRERPIVGTPETASTQPTFLAEVRETFALPLLVLERYTGRTILDQASKLESPLPEERREAIVSVVRRDVGKREPYTAVYRVMGRFDEDPIVRATAVRATNRSRDRDPEAAAGLTKALSDGHPAVRLEAAKALANLPSAGAAAGLRAMAADDKQTPDARIAAADALRHYKDVETARALIGLLNGKDFGLAWQARRSLYLMLGVDFRYDEAAWLSYVAGPLKPVG